LPGPSGLPGPRGEMGLDGIAGSEVCKSACKRIYLRGQWGENLEL
jgi:hypothetical protein